ncbi:hotdog domain-containing protein [Paraburkholderia lycopersici]|uniref:hotdog domain-containing protein n=1 Tax=Paraburkholderia lycopersici TaxID=416944 RepID=UPI001160FA16|nr:hotdog domain-containing protein [Paraburkholderia lycopersici]
MIAGMMDCAMSIAGILHFRGRTCGTVQLSLHFMKPVRCKAQMVECHAVRRASGVVFLEARLLESDQRCAVMATGMVGVTRVAGQGARGWVRELAGAGRSLRCVGDGRCRAGAGAGAQYDEGVNG